MVSDAYRFIFPILVAAALAAALNLPGLALVAVALGGFVAYFFRNPKRTIPDGPGLVVSPADGKVVEITPLPEDEEGQVGHRIGIFLRIYDVHVNRSPIRGEVVGFVYKRGLFKPAFAAGVSGVNEQNVLTIRGEGMTVVVRQIAGVIARRVVCWKRPGESFGGGEGYGLVRMGCGVDVLLSRACAC